MTPAMKKRLDKVAQQLSCKDIRPVLVFQVVNETSQQAQEKVERWKAGETVKGISTVYEGGELDIRIIRYVEAKNPYLD